LSPSDAATRIRQEKFEPDAVQDPVSFHVTVVDMGALEGPVDDVEL
jgi:hypothetical protein